jgi:hypothetical protein
VAWLGYNARYVRDLASAEDSDARSEILEVLHATADPEYSVLTNFPDLEDALAEELEALGGDDFWASIEGSDEWATYKPPVRDSAVFLSGGAAEVKSLALEKGLDETLADALGRAVKEGESHELAILSRAGADRAAVAVIVSSWHHHEEVGELPPAHLYRGGSQTAWTVVDLPRDSPLTRVVDVFVLDAAGMRALVATDREGYFRTTDGGATWQSANFGESRLRAGGSLQTFPVGPELYALAVLNHQPGDDDNPLFRLERREWVERWRVGLQGWLGGAR